MKIIRYILSAILFSGGLYACTDEWNSHYAEENKPINNDAISVVESSAVDYLKSEPSLSSMYNLFKETGVVETMNGKDQLFTILVVNNNSIVDKRSASTDDKVYLAKSHISDIALSPANLLDGQRVLMWNGKYIRVNKQENEDKSTTISFNGTKVTKVTKVTNGYIYELETYVDSPKSMYEIIETLGDNYSVFKNMILSKNQKIFNKEASIPIGVDKTGSTVYDSVFIVTNPYFNARGFDIMSESLTATMLIPSNEVIQQALDRAHENLETWGLTRADSILNNWIFQSAFFKKQLSKQDFIDNEDLTSVFEKQWRTTVQEIDLDHPVSMSNGTAYYVESMKVPTNVLIYRIKDYMKWYEFLSDTDKERYFSAENLTFSKMETMVTEWSGWPAGGFPKIENRLLRYVLTDTGTKEYRLNFVPFRYKEGGGSYQATPYLIPPGEYDLCLGFEQKLGHDVEVSCNGKVVNTITASELTSTTFHYDRGGQGYPEGYDLNKATDKKKTNYDRDGGKIGVITITGTEPVQLTLTFHGLKVQNGKTCFHHWCLRPTKNCY